MSRKNNLPNAKQAWLGGNREGTNDFLRCPQGHKLPNHTDKGDCTPVYCPGWVGGTAKRHDARVKGELIAVSKEADGELEQLLPPEAKEAEPLAKTEKADALVKLSHAAGRSAARKAFFKVPANLAPADAEAWAQAKAVQLLPDAMAELEYQLKLGDDGQRRDAARDVLDINGMRKREAGNGGGATIILNLGGKELPWAQKVVEKLSEPAQVVDADE